MPVGYSCSGVSPAIFAQAFGLPPGSSCSNTTISALKLGIQNKGLRYGSVLALSGPVVNAFLSSFSTVKQRRKRGAFASLGLGLG